MEDYIPYDLQPDDDTEELPTRKYKPLPAEPLEFPDFELFKIIPVILKSVF